MNVTSNKPALSGWYSYQEVDEGAGVSEPHIWKNPLESVDVSKGFSIDLEMLSPLPMLILSSDMFYPSDIGPF